MSTIPMWVFFVVVVVVIFLVLAKIASIMLDGDPENGYSDLLLIYRGRCSIFHTEYCLL